MSKKLRFIATSFVDAGFRYERDYDIEDIIGYSDDELPEVYGTTEDGELDTEAILAEVWDNEGVFIEEFMHDAIDVDIEVVDQ